jgi:hypothetical protein
LDTIIIIFHWCYPITKFLFVKPLSKYWLLGLVLPVVPFEQS